MTIIDMSLMQPCISARRISPATQEIINKMIQLLAARRNGKLSRRQFLTLWGKLREALRWTYDYVKLREHVAKRCHGVCEHAGCKRPFAHMHHLHRVALRPDLALDPSNVQGLCFKCHKAEPHA